jgi:hypothetical protein
MLAIQKGCFDELWDTPFIELIDQISDSVPPTGPAYTAIAEQLNVSNAIYAHEIKTFRQAYRAEAFGVADLFGDVIAQSMCAIGVRAGALAADVDYRPHPDILDIAKRLIGAALEKDKARDTLRSLHIQASAACGHPLGQTAQARWPRHSRHGACERRPGVIATIFSRKSRWQAKSARSTCNSTNAMAARCAELPRKRWRLRGN